MAGTFQLNHELALISEARLHHVARGHESLDNATIWSGTTRPR
jgi:hypothetical protein